MTPDRCTVCDRAECPALLRHDHTDLRPCLGCVAANDCHAHRVDWRVRCFTSHADGFRAGFKAAIAWAIDRSRIPTETT